MAERRKSTVNGRHGDRPKAFIDTNDGQIDWKTGLKWMKLTSFWRIHVASSNRDEKNRETINKLTGRTDTARRRSWSRESVCGYVNSVANGANEKPYVMYFHGTRFLARTRKRRSVLRVLSRIVFSTNTTFFEQLGTLIIYRPIRFKHRPIRGLSRMELFRRVKTCTVSRLIFFQSFAFS